MNRTVIMNGKPRRVDTEMLAYEDVVEMTHGHRRPGITVVYRGCEGKDGSLCPGEGVVIKEVAIFSLKT